MSFDNRTGAIAVVVGAGLLLGGAGAAFAGPVSNSSGPQGFSVQASGTASQSLHFDQFSTALGTLDEVDILLTGSTIGGGSSVSLTGAEGGDRGSASFTANLAVTGPGAAALTGGVSATASCVASGSTCASGLVAPTLGSNAFSPNPVQITLPASLLPFEGNGTVDLLAGIANFVPDNTCTPVPGSRAVCSPLNDVSWSGSLTVSYLYTPTGVPEPASLGLLGVGLAAMTTLRRRRRT